MNKIFLLLLFSAVGMFCAGQIAYASTSALFVSPASLTSQAGVSFNVALQINSAGNIICVVQGTLSFKNMSCQSVKVASGLVAQTAPSCASPGFLIGIPKCTTANLRILSISAAGTKAGQASVSVTSAKVIGVGADVPFSSQPGVYNITSPTKKPPATPVISPPATTTTNNPIPAITSLSSTGKTAGDPDFTLTVMGSNFVPSSFVNFAGLVKDTTYVNQNQLTVDILASDLAVPGSFTITVTNPAPGGGTSNAEILMVNAKSQPAPLQSPISESVIILSGIIIVAGILAGVVLIKLFLIISRRR